MSSPRKLLSETIALNTLDKIRDEFRSSAGFFERKAKSCSACETPGACCLDAHFVNVRISRLEAIAIRRVLDELPAAERVEIDRKINSTIKLFRLDVDIDKTYACPLYDREAGCLVHDRAKPLPCIHHACYDRKEDLPPDDLLDKTELAVERLNLSVYCKPQPLVSLPVAIRKAERT